MKIPSLLAAEHQNMVGIAIAATAVVTVRQKNGRGSVDRRGGYFFITRRDFALTKFSRKKSSSKRAW